MTIANAIWLATAQLHRENAKAADFSVREIIERATRENLVDGFRPGLQVFVSKHCVANKSPNPLYGRMLYETARGRRRLFKIGDPFHEGRRKGKIRPEKQELPEEYRGLIDWYDEVYSKQIPAAGANPVFQRPATGPDAAQLASAVAFVGSAGSVVIPADLRKQLGIEEGTRLGLWREDDHLVLQPVTEAYISSLRGCCKGEDSLVEAREREHRMEK